MQQHRDDLDTFFLKLESGAELTPKEIARMKGLTERLRKGWQMEGEIEEFWTEEE